MSETWPHLGCIIPYCVKVPCFITCSAVGGGLGRFQFRALTTYPAVNSLDRVCGARRHARVGGTAREAEPRIVGRAYAQSACVSQAHTRSSCSEPHMHPPSPCVPVALSPASLWYHPSLRFALLLLLFVILICVRTDTVCCHRHPTVD